MSSTDSYQPYVEDYDSVISEVVPLTRRHTARGKSGLSKEMSSSYDGISDSGYSSTNTPNIDSPPLKSTTPAPESMSRKESYKRASTPGIQRPVSKAFNRISTSSPAIPRNIPGAKPRERSPTTATSTGGADECDCSDCKKETKGSPSSPSVLSGAFPLHRSYHGAYSHSPTWSNGYPQYPSSSTNYDTTYDSYGRSFEGNMPERNEKKNRSSMPPPPRPSSTFSGTTSSSYSTGYGNYFGQLSHAPSPAPVPPAPSTTCPPGAFSAYAPPPLPLNTSIAPNSDSYSYNSPSIASYAGSYSHEPWIRTTTPINSGSSYSSADYLAMPPPPPLNTTGTCNGSSRRNSMRAQVNPGVPFYDHDDYQQPPQRRSSRAHADHSPWTAPSYLDGLDRSVSVPPQGSSAIESARRKISTPGPVQARRRESVSNSALYTGRIGPSALSRAMESCAIEDEPPIRCHSRSHSDYHSSHSSSHGQLARRETGMLMQQSNNGYTSLHHSGSREELVQMTVPDSDGGETFTMRYPAGIPVKLQLNGGAHKTVAFGSKDKNESVERDLAYRYVQQRQQQVHAQLQYGAMEHSGSRKTTSGDYSYRPSSYGRRATMSGA